MKVKDLDKIVKGVVQIWTCDYVDQIRQVIDISHLDGADILLEAEVKSVSPFIETYPGTDPWKWKAITLVELTEDFELPKAYRFDDLGKKAKKRALADERKMWEYFRDEDVDPSETSDEDLAEYMIDCGYWFISDGSYVSSDRDGAEPDMDRLLEYLAEGKGLS